KMSGTALIYEQMTCYKLLCESPSLLYIVNVYHCVKLTIGATLQLVDSVMTGRVRNGRALVRHHSQRSAAKGFCKHYNVKRVLIVAWDVHHGQTFLFSSECLLYPNRIFWLESDYDSVGKEKGAGFNSNVTWNKVGMENSDYLSVFFHVLLPVAYEFSPGLVFVCAGIDCHWRPRGKGHMCATPDVFAHQTHLPMSLAGGETVYSPGGYNLTSLRLAILSQYWTCTSQQGYWWRTLSWCLISLHRLLVVFLGDGQIPAYITENGKVLMVQISKEPEDQKPRYHVSVLLRIYDCLVAGSAHQYDPGLVLLARGPSCGFGQAAWAQIISLLHGLAQGHTLALLQVRGTLREGATAASPLGDPAPSLRPLGTPLPEDVEAMERLRQRLQKTLGTTADRR
uniref:Histone deacetylase domain-containing protein n=1 Tax=Salmo trutta TaxID=8032 RepID=A0A673WSN8_SALTR